MTGATGTAARGPPTVLFTFDDGFECVYEYAYPVLAAAGMPATFYVTTNKVGDVGEGRITLAHLQDLSANGWDIGNHTAAHVDLSTQSEADQETALSTASAYLVANGLADAAYHVAYPYGGWNADTLTAMEATGMITGRTASGLADEFVPLVDWYGIDGVTSLGVDPAPVIAEINGAQRGEIIVLLGHLIGPDLGETGMTAENFAAIVAAVAAKGYRVATITDLYAAYQRGWTWP